jgi:2',3'-cyclic-nucleotide 2'-phosphodiesterase (5'-nucleotidase family)
MSSSNRMQVLPEVAQGVGSGISPTTTIVATNDFHSCVIAGRATLARLRHWRSCGAIVLDAGDFFGGAAFHEFTGGRIEAQLLGEIYDAIVPGNHDLAEIAEPRHQVVHPPVVCANMRPVRQSERRWTGSLLFPDRSPRVGVVGWLGVQAFKAATVEEQALYRFVAPTRELLALERDRLMEAGAEVVVGISHSGFEVDVAKQEADGVFDLVISGHCHSGLYHWSSPDGARQVVKAPENGLGLVRIELTADRPAQITIERPPAAEPDDGLAAVADSYSSWAREPLGVMPASVPGRFELAEQVAERAAALVGAGRFVLNIGAIRAGLPAEVDRGALRDAAPFDSELVLVQSSVTTETVLDQLDAAGEHAICRRHADGDPDLLGTTGYLAARLGYPTTPGGPGLSLRTAVTALLREV